MPECPTMDVNVISDKDIPETIFNDAKCYSDR
jgi:hypothetical protein